MSNFAFVHVHILDVNFVQNDFQTLDVRAPHFFIFHLLHLQIELNRRFESGSLHVSQSFHHIYIYIYIYIYIHLYELYIYYAVIGYDDSIQFDDSMQLDDSIQSAGSRATIRAAGTARNRADKS